MTVATSLDAGNSAVFSECGLCRYTLERRWRDGGRRVCFLMLNPSTADATQDDPTIRRCIGFARRWATDVSALTILNLFAFRSTDPKALLSADDPIGRDNDYWIMRRAADCDVVCAWGANAERVNKLRVPAVMDMLWLVEARTYALSFTLRGDPGHPLYLASANMPQPWKPQSLRWRQGTPS